MFPINETRSIRKLYKPYMKRAREAGEIPEYKTKSAPKWTFKRAITWTIVVVIWGGLIYLSK